jgi:RNA polymerase sigma-70 factor (family 1)
MEKVSSAHAAFKTLFAQEYSNLCRYALTFLNDAHHAEDVVQETFIKIWEKKQDLILMPEIRYYLITAVRNNCISAIRKIRTQNVQYTEAAPEPEPEPYLTAMQHREQATEQSRKIAEALDRLPAKCREVFLMVKMQGLSYKQTAEALDIAVKTVENQMGKALRVLRENPVYTLLVTLLFLELIRRPVGVLLYHYVFN